MGGGSDCLLVVVTVVAAVVVVGVGMVIQSGAGGDCTDAL